MQDLRDTDGSRTHRKTIRFHMAKCRSGGTPLHAKLRTEATTIYADLKTKERAHEDAEDDLVDATAEVDTNEIALENAIRDVDNALVSFDRDNPEKNARAAVFPEGFGAVIEPEGDKQLVVLPALHVRLKPYESEPVLAEPLAKLVAAEAAFKLSLTAEEEASSAVATAFEEERGARTQVREQLRSAHGRLRALYKARPALAEQFFIKLGRKEGRAKPPKDTGVVGGEGPAGGTPPASGGPADGKPPVG